MKEKRLMSDMAFNTWAIFIYFFFQWVTTLVVVRLSGYDDAGLFSLTISFVNMFSFIGLFGVRGYQVCDVRETFSNGDYIGSRIVTTLLSVILFTVLLIIRNYDAALTVSCLSYMVFKSLEGFGDVAFGVMQRLKRYDWIAASMSIKGILTLAAFTLPLFLGAGLWVSILCMAAVYLLSLLLYDAFKLRNAGIFTPSFKKLRFILPACFPLMLSTLVSAVMMYVPREAIGNALGSKALGFYASISMVMVIFSTLAASVWGTITPRISTIILNGDIKSLKSIFAKIAVILLIASAAILISGKILGPFVYNLLFGEEILDYMFLVIPVLINAILLMCISFFDRVFIPLKRHRELFLCNAAGLAVCLISAPPLTAGYGMTGANCSMILGFSVRLLSLIILTVRYLKKLEVNNYDAD